MPVRAELEPDPEVHSESPSQATPRVRRSLRWAVAVLAAALVVTFLVVRPVVRTEGTPGYMVGQRFGNLHLLVLYGPNAPPVFQTARNRNNGRWGVAARLWGKGICIVWHPKGPPEWTDLHP